MPWSFGAERVESAQRLFEDLMIEKEEGGESLVLGAFGHLAVDCQMGQESLNFCRAKKGRMHPLPAGLSLEPQKLLRPAKVGLNRPGCEVLLETSLPILLEDFHNEKSWRARILLSITGLSRRRHPHAGVRFAPLPIVDFSHAEV